MSLMAANEESDPSAILNGFWVTLFQLYIISSITPPHILHFFFSLTVAIYSVYHKIFQVLYYIFNLFYLFLVGYTTIP